MKRYNPLILVCLTLLIGLQGCKREIVKPLFEVESVASLTIRAGLNTVETHHYIIEDIASTLLAQLETRNLSMDDIKVIKPQVIVFTSLDNETNFSFIQAVTVDMYTRKNPTRAEIAFQEFIPLSTKSELTLFPSLLNIKDYLAEELFSIDIALRVRTFLPRNVDTRVDIIFQVEE